MEREKIKQKKKILKPTVPNLNHLGSNPNPAQISHHYRH